MTINLLVISVSVANEIEFTASVDRALTSRSQPVYLTLSIISSESLSHMPSPDLDLSNFVVEGPSVGIRTEFVNGRVTHARELTYTLYGRKEGVFVIGPAKLQLGGQTYSTKPIQLVVSKEIASNQQKNQNGRDSSVLEDNLFVRVERDKDQVFVGEQVLLSYDLCYRYQLRDVGFKEVPSYSGFWTKDLFVAQRLDATRQMINGMSFHVAPLRKLALFPASAGKHVVDPLAISCSISQSGRRRSRFDAFSFFDDPFFGRSQTLIVTSDSVSIDVLPLPRDGQPTAFDGAVGSYDLSSSVQPATVRAGDPVTLRVLIQGKGNIDALGEPKLSDIKGVKKYDPKIQQKQNIDSNGYGGSKSLEYILIPEAPGEFIVPEVTFSFFNPSTQRYQTLATKSQKLLVGGVVEEESGTAYSLSRKDIEVVGSDIRHIKPDVLDLGSDGKYFYRRFSFWLFQSIMPIAYAGLYFWNRHRRRLEGDVAYARRRGAFAAASQRLKHARKMLVDGSASGEFYAEIERGLLGFVADHANRPTAGLGRKECDRELKSRGADETLTSALMEVLETCEVSRYAPGMAAADQMKQIQEKAEELLGKFQKALS